MPDITEEYALEYAHWLEAVNKRLRETLVELVTAEAEYRLCHDRYGDGDLRSGKAWDRMRRAGDAAYKSLEQPEPPGEEA